MRFALPVRSPADSLPGARLHRPVWRRAIVATALVAASLAAMLALSSPSSAAPGTETRSGTLTAIGLALTPLSPKEAVAASVIGEADISGPRLTTDGSGDLYRFESPVLRAP